MTKKELIKSIEGERDRILTTLLELIKEDVCVGRLLDDTISVYHFNQKVYNTQLDILRKE